MMEPSSSSSSGAAAVTPPAAEVLCDDGGGGVTKPKKSRLVPPVARPRQVSAVSCPVFVAERSDLVNFDLFVSRIWRECQAWRYGIAKVVLKPEVYREFFDPEGHGICWDEKDPTCSSFWKNFSQAKVTRTVSQRVQKVDGGLFKVENTVEVLSEPVGVQTFLTQAQEMGVLHPACPETADEKILLSEMPTTVFTSDHDVVGDLLPFERKVFWDNLESQMVGEWSSPAPYVTELNYEPLSEEEAEQRLSTDPGGRQVSYW